MKLVSSPNLESVLPAQPLSSYLLLEHQPDLHEHLFSLSADPQMVYLYEDTSLQELMLQGPILLPMSSGSPIYQAYAESPDEKPGLLLFSDSPLPEILSCLRHRLIVRFESVRRAVFRYYDPRVASYFFPACTAADMHTWFNPIQSIVWYGGTWANAAEKQFQWHSIVHTPKQNTSPPEEELLLTEVQEKALSQMDCERFVWNWCLQSSSPFRDGMIYLNEGFSLGLTDSEVLIDYLNLRSSSPHLELPDQKTLIGSDTQRLSQIQKHIEGSSQFRR